MVSLTIVIRLMTNFGEDWKSIEIIAFLAKIKK